MFTLNKSDADGAQIFLDSYCKDKLNISTKLQYDTTNVIDLSIKKHDYESIFSKLNLKLDCMDNCMEDAYTMICPTEEVLQSYWDFETLINQKFSMLDVFSQNISTTIRKIKNMFGDYYPIILINTYKYKMMQDFYWNLNSQQSHYMIIHKIFILTLMSIVDNVEDCVELSKDDVRWFIDTINKPPSLEFCKRLVHLHKVACLIENKNDKKCILYNNTEYNSKLYIHFEFHSKFLVVLRSVTIKP